MRVGEVSVRLVPVGGGEMVEGEDGRVLARPRQVYAVHLANHSDRRAVARVSVDGLPMTGGGLVLAPDASLTLERPVHDGEQGHFTVFPEGTEEVFGDDGGRGNPELGLVEVEYRRELEPPPVRVAIPQIPAPRVRELDFPAVPGPAPRPAPGAPPAAPAPPPGMPRIWSSATAPALPMQSPPAPGIVFRESDVDSAAGTGLTGRSEQGFRTVAVGALEETATRVVLRIVIGRPEAFGRARPLPGGGERAVPPRPAPRP